MNGEGAAVLQGSSDERQQRGSALPVQAGRLCVTERACTVQAGRLCVTEGACTVQAGRQRRAALPAARPTLAAASALPTASSAFCFTYPVPSRPLCGGVSGRGGGGSVRSTQPSGWRGPREPRPAGRLRFQHTPRTCARTCSASRTTSCTSAAAPATVSLTRWAASLQAIGGKEKSMAG